MTERFFGQVLRLRWPIIVFYILLVIPFAYFATKLETDNSLDRMIVPGDEGKKVFDRFREAFGSDEFILVALEGKKIFSAPFSPKWMKSSVSCRKFLIYRRAAL